MQNTTQVIFKITVPAYQSDALQVGLTWGEKKLKANWVGDEFWTATDDFSTNTTNQLAVYFYDDNGGMTLGSFETEYKTGTNASETYQVTEDQFDLSRWDDDADGVSNVDELIASSDPLDADDLPQSSSGELLDNFSIAYRADVISSNFETEILSIGLPASVDEDEFIDHLPFNSTTTTRDIDISTDGNGTFNKTYDFFIALDVPYHASSKGTRSSEGKTVSWAGSTLYTGSSYYYSKGDENLKVSSTINGTELNQTGEGTLRFWRPLPIKTATTIHTFEYDVVLDLNSKNDDHTCLILHGSFSRTFETHDGTIVPELQTVSRSSADDLWKWTDTTNGRPNTSF